MSSTTSSSSLFDLSSSSSDSKRPSPATTPPDPPPPAGTAPKLKPEEPDWGLLCAFGCFVVTSLGNRLFQKLMTYPMFNYPITVNLVTTIAYVPACFAYIIPAIHCIDPSPITEEQRHIPKSRFAVMGALDCVSSLMQILAVNFIPNASTLVLLQQSAIPISMVISRLSFKHVRYDAWQIGGAAVVLCGIGIVLAPQAASPAVPMADDATDDDSYVSSRFLPQWVWSVTIILSCIPMALSSVYKEMALGEHDVDVVFLNGWIAVFQVILSLPMALPTAVATALPLEEVPRNVINGFKCYVGVNSVQEPAEHLVVDACGTAPYFVTAFIVFNLVYNVLIVIILKRGSSSLLYLSSTVLVPVNNVMFSLKFIPGHKPLHFADVLGLIVIMFGLCLYRGGKWALDFIVQREPITKAILKLLVVEEEDADDDAAAALLDEEEPQLGALVCPVDPNATPERQRAQRIAIIQDREKRRKRLLAERRDAVEPPSPLLRESLQQSATLRRMARNLLHRRQREPLLARRGKPLAAPPVTRFFGLNQIEMLQPMLQAQRSNMQQRRARTNAQIRQDFLLKLGFSPDPATVDRSPARLQRPRQSSPRAGRSPGELRRMHQQRPPGLPRPTPASSAGNPQQSGFTRLGDRGRVSSFDSRSHDAVQRARRAFG